MAASTTWQMDPAHTTVEAAVKHMMFTTVRGRMSLKNGSIAIDESNPDRSHVEVEIDAKSIDTGTADRDAHLRSADFLDAEHYPVITFRSKQVDGAYQKPGDRFRVVGDLTIRGVTNEVTLDCEFQGIGKDPWGGTRAGFSASTKIDRTVWGLKWNQALETGGILVANELRIEIDVQAVKQGATSEAAA